MIIIILIALVILLLIWGVVTYNRLVTELLKVQTQWSQIDVVLKQRFDLIPNLIAKMFHFQKEEFFKVEESEKGKVGVKF